MEKVFRTNLDFNHYTPWYDYYNEFLDITIERATKENPNFKEKSNLTEEVKSFENLYKFATTNPVEIISIYYQSLFSEYSILTNK